MKKNFPTSLVNISIDDISPHAKSGIGVLDRCFELIEKYPDIKFSLFVPIAYWRTDRHHTHGPLYLSEHLEFCKVLRNLPKKNFEICYHGFHHGDVKNKNDNDEFENLGKLEVFDKIHDMSHELNRAGMENEFKKIFRPPAWRISRAALNMLSGHDFVFALSDKPYTMLIHEYKKEELIKKFKVVFYNVCPPFEPLALHEKTEIVYHACEWDKNFLDKQKTAELIKFLEEKKEHIEFSFIEGLL